MCIPVHNCLRSVCRSIPTRCSKTVRWRNNHLYIFVQEREDQESPFSILRKSDTQYA